jgi:hypothetical protein
MKTQPWLLAPFCLGLLAPTSAAFALDVTSVLETYCTDYGDKTNFSCDQGSTVIATVDAPRDGGWGNGYTTQYLVDKGLPCTVSAEKQLGSLLEDAWVSCSVNVTWALNPGDAGISHTVDVGFGDPIEKGHPNIQTADGGTKPFEEVYPSLPPAAVHVNSVNCACVARSFAPD